MATKRTPLKRNMKRQIIPEAVEVFRRMEAAASACTCEPIDWDGEYWKHEQCPACRGWWDAHARLWVLVGAKLWQFPCVQDPEDECPYPEGCHAAAHWERTRQERPEAFELHRALKQATVAMETRSPEDNG